MKEGTLVAHWVSKTLGVITEVGQNCYKVLWFNTTKVQWIAPQRLEEVKKCP